MRRDEVTTHGASGSKGGDDLPQSADFSLWRRAHRSDSEAVAVSEGPADGERAPLLRGSWTSWLVKLSALWAFVELPVEYLSAQDGAERISLVLSTMLWVFTILLVLRGNLVARGVFVFFCALGVLAIAPALPAEYAMFRLAFYLSLIECVVKCLLFVAFVSRYIAIEA